MPLEYTNRRGDRYFVLEGKTKTGKPKYYCSKKPHGASVERLPEGYEIYENPRDAVVTIRRVRTSPILSVEREMLQKWAGEYAREVETIVDINGESLVVYTSDIDAERSDRIIRALAGGAPVRLREKREWLTRHATYTPMFRFRLVDEDERIYCVERWCFHSAIDGWYLLSGGAPLDEQARKFLPHLGKESFFELI